MNTMKTLNPHLGAEALRRAIKRAGGMRKLAEMLGGKTKSQTIGNWISRGVPKDRCLQIENLTGVRCEDLRPDIDWSHLQEVMVARVRRSLDASDDVQPPTGGSTRKTKEAKLSNG